MDSAPPTRRKLASGSLGDDVPWQSQGEPAATLPELRPEPGQRQARDADASDLPARQQALAGVRTGIGRLLDMVADPETGTRDYLEAMDRLAKIADITKESQERDPVKAMSRDQLTAVLKATLAEIAECDPAVRMGLTPGAADTVQ